jgi:hypothetical protein
MIYLSGSLTSGGTKPIDASAFNEAERKFKAEGYEVFNPASMEQKDPRPWEWYLSRDLLWIYEHQPVMYMLKGWETSVGARLEWQFAKRMGLRITYQDDISL